MGWESFDVTGFDLGPPPSRWLPRLFFSTFSMDFCWSSRVKGIIGKDLKFAGFVPHYKILTGNILASF